MTFYYDRTYSLSEQLISDLEVDINEHKPVTMEAVSDVPELYWQRINRSIPLMMVFPDDNEDLPTEFNIESDLQSSVSSYFYSTSIQDAWESSPHWPNVDNLYQYLHQVRDALDNQE